MADNDSDESAPTRWNASGGDFTMWMNWDDDPRNNGSTPEGERATLAYISRGDDPRTPRRPREQA